MDTSTDTAATARSLTHSQRQIWTGQQLAGDAPLYNTPFTFRLRGGLDVDRFCGAYAAAVDRCEALRTKVVPGEDGVPRTQQVQPSEALNCVDLSNEADPEGALEKLIATHARRALDLNRPLVDSFLARLGPNDHCWYLNQHHLVTDAWSTTVVYRLVEACYRGLDSGSLPEATPSYADFVRFEEGSARPGDEKSRAFWRDRADGAASALSLIHI